MKKILTTLIFTLLTLTASTASLRPQEPSKVILNTKNTVLLRGAISGSSMISVTHNLLDAIAERGNKDYPIYLVIDSPGGEVFAAMNFVDFFSQFDNIKTICMYCASAAHMIAQLMPGERLVQETGFYMAHRARATFSGQFNPGEVEQRLKLVSSYITDIEKRVAARIGISLREYRKRITNEWYSTAGQAIEENVTDHVVKLECTNALINKRVKTTIQVMIFSKEIITSGCPTLKVPMQKQK